ncbi:MAG TPA: MBL fold metallo-hydrolase [Dehalococcoidia bacterium]|jgi:glyoxylase-like metal-dependent hydrolase (beta-lactamase superfamily II)
MLPPGAAVRSILPGVVQAPLRATSCFLLLDRRVTLIDTGLPGSAARILRAVALCRRRPDEIERIVITHYHPDHLGGLAELQRLLPAKAAIHAVEAPVVQSSEGPPPPFASGALRTVSWSVAKRAFRYTPVHIDEPLHDGDELATLGGMRVVHTPGHTPGHIALYFPRMALLIAGDAMEYRAGVLSGPAARVTADMAQALASVRRLATLEVEVIAFSHFPRLPVQAGAALQALAQRLA